MLLACLALAPGASARGLPFQGVQLSPATLGGNAEFDAKQLDLAKDLGANVVKVDTLWSALEPTAKGEQNPEYLARLDALVNGAATRGMKTVLLFRNSPCWATTAPQGCKDDYGPFPPKNPQDYADALTFLVTRYGTKLAAVEIWNEPDHEGEYYFGGSNKAKNYTAILKAAYPAVKKANRKVVVIGGSLVGSAGKFLAQMYKYGAKGNYDVLGVHFYTLVLASVRSIEVVKQAHRDRAPIWVSEFGWTTCGNGHEGGFDCVTPRMQAQDLSDVFAGFTKSRLVKGALIFNAVDDPNGGGFDFGLADRNFAKKPAFNAVKKSFASPGRPRGLTLRISGGAATGTAPAGDVVVLTFYNKDGSQSFQKVVPPDKNGNYRVSLGGFHGKVTADQPWTGRKATARA